MMTLSFVCLLLVFLGVGLWSVRQKQSTTEDYLLANRSIGPWAIGLSTMATGQSGFKFIGLIGYSYLTGVSGIWLVLGWFLGDYLAWNSGVPERLRKKSAKERAVTLPTYLAQKKGQVSPALSLTIGAIIFLFLASYAAAQLAAAGKSLQSMLGWHYDTGAYLSAGLIFLYCYAGGIRASIWTDVAQALVMLLGMWALTWMSLQAAGGLSSTWASLEALDPALTQPMPQGMGWFALFFLSLIVSGFGVLGQPHVMVRSMAIDHASNMQLVRRIYLYLGYTMSIGGYLVGLAARVIFPTRARFPPEMIMPELTQVLFHPVLAGFLLAALFASTISTADSQILVCASAFLGRPSNQARRNYLRLKLATTVTILLTLTIALHSNGVFSLVMFSWSVLASSLTALLILKTMQERPPVGVTMAMILGGGSTAILWRAFGLNANCYETLPGISVSLLPYLGWLAVKKRQAAGTNLPQKHRGHAKAKVTTTHS